MLAAAAIAVLLGATPARSRLALPEERYAPHIATAIRATSEVYRVPEPLVKAVIHVESSFNPAAVSPAGAVGLMQLMPSTARRVGLRTEELGDPARNILGGVRLLAILLRHYRGDVISALVAYNARPRQIFAPVPQNRETPVYVRRVLRAMKAFERRGEGRESP